MSPDRAHDGQCSDADLFFVNGVTCLRRNFLEAVSRHNWQAQVIGVFIAKFDECDIRRHLSENRENGPG